MTFLAGIALGFIIGFLVAAYAVSQSGRWH